MNRRELANVVVVLPLSLGTGVEHLHFWERKLRPDKAAGTPLGSQNSGLGNKVV